VATGLAAHAAKVKDVKLKLLSDVSENVFKNMREADFVTYIGNLYERRY
jgi:hypothetical protein